ncbi:MAG: hypothetical protein Q4B96_00620 [Bacillota bacterium]|nr:hypothetical protein [Bacillota bacterium]
MSVYSRVLIVVAALLLLIGVCYYAAARPYAGVPAQAWHSLYNVYPDEPWRV